MLKRLRIKFVATIMVSVAVVLAVVFTVMCATEYQRAMTTIDNALSNSIERASGQFGNINRYGLANDDSTREQDGKRTEDGEGSSSNSSSDADLDDSGQADPLAEFDDEFESGFFGLQIGGPRDEALNITPIAVYSLTDEHSLQIVSGYTTAFIDSNVAASAAERLSAREDGSGVLSDLGLVYQKRTIGTTTYVAFADESSTDTWQSLALSLLVAALVALVIFFAVSLLLSKRMLKPVEEAWRSQRQFVADASHDLKTPLTVILANSAILLKHPERSIASESQWVESTQVEAEHMQGLVNEMLELAQVEAGEEVAFEMEALDFSDLVDGETLLFDSVALERNCAFDCRIAEGVTVMGDEQKLRKMVATIIENAFKYVDGGGVVRITLERDGKKVRLAINNSGCEIPAEDLPHIFDRFYRTDKARTSGAGGFGLGLAIARETARVHGGDITCASGTADGTTFTITLPTA